MWLRDCAACTTRFGNMDAKRVERRKGQQKARKAKYKARKDELELGKTLAAKSEKVSVLTVGSPSEVVPAGLSRGGSSASSDFDVQLM